MRKFSTVVLILGMAMLLASSALAVPRLQTYIVGSKYGSYGVGNNSWLTQNSTFDLKVAGYWQSGNRPRPRYDWMGVGLIIAVPRGETGAVWINGMKITSFYNAPPGMMGSGAMGGSMRFARVRLRGLGVIDNNQRRAWHYDRGQIHQPGWGDELLVNVSVSGFSWSHFGAFGVSRYGRLFYTPDSHDAGYYSGGFATPEPGTLSLLGLGLLGLAPFLRRKKQR